MIKLKTGISTSLDFVKAMKERGQDVSPALPAAALRDQLDALSDDVKVTFKSDNETVLQVVNDYEPEPPTDKVTVTIDLNGGSIEDSSLLTIEMDKGSSFVKQTWLGEAEMAGLQSPDAEIYEFDDLTTVKDDAETKIAESVVINENTTFYVLWRGIYEIILDDPESQADNAKDALESMDALTIYETMFEPYAEEGNPRSIFIRTATYRDDGMCDFTSETSASLTLNEGELEVSVEQDPDSGDWTLFVVQPAILTLDYSPAGYALEPETGLPTITSDEVSTAVGETYEFSDPTDSMRYIPEGCTFGGWDYEGTTYQAGDFINIESVDSIASAIWDEATEPAEEGE